jgi:pimeloyl-ACP methyl ester carboxylesterase
MPGYGQADKPTHFDDTVDGYARHLAASLDQLGVMQVHLVLHDFGGPWGLAWATEAPALGQAEASMTRRLVAEPVCEHAERRGRETVPAGWRRWAAAAPGRTDHPVAPRARRGRATGDRPRRRVP